ncbi:GNAT family acetyltransferase [Glutamicibacter uratoxydans]|uniref:GNAT family acetyltransferase n=1 Tax=Glutamicibacter uratoxydans TaxID=43667 RepID=A0A4Y4DPN0_GLUUR|nr:GNAT family acetyltransferase [Glutamicibacter uratoxydans]GED06876.1 GNAT family acetyltransferase [Glutamicibacter uratoxydans]
MDIAELEEAMIPQAVELWERTGLTRPWNDAAADARQALSTETSTILALVHGGSLQATAMAGFDGHRGWLYYVAVDPQLQSRGLGKRIVQEAIEWLKGRGAVKVQLMIRSENKKVAEFYEALGFEDASVQVLGKRIAP